MKNCINILIVEDELLIAEMLKEMLIELSYNVVGIAKNYNQTLNYLEKKLNIDLVFLDINLSSEKNGLDIGNYIKENYQIPFLYLTSNSDTKTVITASETLPENYLIKPFTKNTLFAALEIFKSKLNNKPKQIKFKDGIKNVVLMSDQIRFVKSEKNYIEINTEDKKFVLRQSLDGFIKELKSKDFIRVHRSYAVNKKYIDSYQKQTILIMGHKIPVSRNYKKEIQAVLM